MKHPTWELVIGLETHVQLSTTTKIFSGSSTRYGAPANTQANAVDLALPGTLPVMNRDAVTRAIRFGLAVGATINPCSVFARKNYFYPDLPKNYQITQFEQPIVIGGSVSFPLGQDIQRIVLTRAHLEEDAGKSLHEDYAGMSGIDLNRAGTPLLEIVTEPDMRSAEQAVAYAKALHGLVRWLEICDGNMQEGSFRIDANVSVRAWGAEQYGTRCEIKNLNSFRFLERAILSEARRQIELIEDGGKVVQQTRLYDPDRDETRAMRSKEDAHDYRYFPDPDLPPLCVDVAWIDQVRTALPILPDALRTHFEQTFGLSAYDAALLTQSREMADYFSAVCGLLNDAAPYPKLAANWLLGELSAALNRSGQDIAHCLMTPSHLAQLLERLQDGTLSNKLAKTVFAACWEEGVFPDQIIERQGLRQISDQGALDRLIDEVLSANAPIVEQYREGKEKAFNALIGLIMKAAKGRANPQALDPLLRARLTRN